MTNLMILLLQGTPVPEVAPEAPVPETVIKPPQEAFKKRLKNPRLELKS